MKNKKNTRLCLVPIPTLGRASLYQNIEVTNA